MTKSFAASKIEPDTYENAPWNVPVPVSPSGFTPLRPEHAEYNVQVDLAKISAYASPRRAIPAEELVFADLQTNIDSFFAGRLGAGRSGFYRHKYIKGIGRTSLAGNWNNPRDNHNTGHLPASATVREYIVSCYLRAKRAEHLINPCDGILLKELPRDIAEHHNLLTCTTCKEGPLPCNTRMQGITLKDPTFARFSNFAWLINHFDPYYFGRVRHISRFFRLFVRYLDPQHHHAPEAITPDLIARLFAAAVERGMANFQAFWRLGVMWVAVHNNTTMDGRFHDLEPPVFLGGPFLGGLLDDPATRLDTPNKKPVFGLGALDFLHHVRVFHRYLVDRLESLRTMDLPLNSLEREYIGAVLEELRAVIDEDHILVSDEALSRRLVDDIRRACNLGSAMTARFKRVVDVHCQVRMRAIGAHKLVLGCHELPLRLARVGVGRALRAHAFEGTGVSPSALEEAQFINDLVTELDSHLEVDTLLAATAEAAAKIERYCRPHGADVVSGPCPAAPVADIVVAS